MWVVIVWRDKDGVAPQDELMEELGGLAGGAWVEEWMAVNERASKNPLREAQEKLLGGLFGEQVR